jgi:hypothetical protein
MSSRGSNFHVIGTTFATSTLVRSTQDADTTEWADEDDGITQTAAESDTVTNGVFTKDEESSEFSLLDGVLDTILGSLRQSTNTSDEDFQFVRKEHQAIVEEWKKHFGRLPALLQRSDDDVSISCLCDNLVRTQPHGDLLSGQNRGHAIYKSCDACCA